MSTATSGYARFDGRARLSLARYTQVAEGDYARITRCADGKLIIEPVPFPERPVAPEGDDDE